LRIEEGSEKEEEEEGQVFGTLYRNPFKDSISSDESYMMEKMVDGKMEL